MYIRVGSAIFILLNVSIYFIFPTFYSSYVLSVAHDIMKLYTRVEMTIKFLSTNLIYFRNFEHIKSKYIKLLINGTIMSDTDTDDSNWEYIIKRIITENETQNIIHTRETITSSISIKPVACKYKFISMKISIQYVENDEFIDYDISMNDGINNYYFSNNRINYGVIWFLLKEQHNIISHQFYPRYNGLIIDHHADVELFTDKQELLLNESDYILT